MVKKYFLSGVLIAILIALYGLSPGTIGGQNKSLRSELPAKNQSTQMSAGIVSVTRRSSVEVDIGRAIIGVGEDKPTNPEARKAIKRQLASAGAQQVSAKINGQHREQIANLVRANGLRLLPVEYLESLPREAAFKQSRRFLESQLERMQNAQELIWLAQKMGVETKLVGQFKLNSDRANLREAKAKASHHLSQNSQASTNASLPEAYRLRRKVTTNRERVTVTKLKPSGHRMKNPDFAQTARLEILRRKIIQRAALRIAELQLS